MAQRLLAEEIDLEAALGEKLAREEDLCGPLEEGVGPGKGERMGAVAETTTGLDEAGRQADHKPYPSPS